MINKLTYKIVDILINNEYTEIIEKSYYFYKKQHMISD